MLLKTCDSKGAEEKFSSIYCKMLENGMCSSDILVLCMSPAQKSRFVNLVKSKLKTDFIEKINIHTFFGYCYNTVKENFYLLQEHLSLNDTLLQPNLCGLEVSGSIFKECIDDNCFKDYNSKKNLLHQLFKRHNLIVQNELSDEDVKSRSKILGETFCDDAKYVLDKFIEKTNEYCSFDYIRQMSLFEYLYKNFDIFKNIKALFWLDADESSPLLYDFVSHISNQLEEYFVSYDPKGSSRRGYLCAETNAQEKLEEIFKVKSTENQNIPKRILNFEQERKITLPFLCVSKYLDMLDCAFNKVKELIENKIPPNEIVIVTPSLNDTLKFYAEEKFNRHRIKYKFLSGSEKLIENYFVKNIFFLLKLKFFKDDFQFEEAEKRNFLNFILKIPLKYLDTLEYEAIVQNDKNSYYKTFLEFINKIEDKDLSLSEKVILAAEKILAFEFEYTKNDLQKYSFLVKEIADFEKCFPKEKFDKEFQLKIVKQMENSIIAENPPGEGLDEYYEDSLLFSTPQKIIDIGKNAKHQIWLDASSVEWKKQDVGILYNSWGFQKNRQIESFNCELNNQLCNEKTFAILRKLVLLSENIDVFASVFDSCGIENFEGILNFIKTQESNEKKNNFMFVPREDQRPVLEYKKGHLAIAAVPGAGKTTVLQALIEKLLLEKVPAENIFVLTYMESAATNFKERIKTTLKNSIEIPNISTIHGLALRIIKENGNYTRVGLDEDFEIIDEVARSRIINWIFTKYNIPQENFEKYEKALSIYKLGTNFSLKNFENQITLQNFVNFANFYNQKLLENNKIDYDDMLRYALDILENNPDILEYYQNICHYIIEDEAQDSSKIQQKLLTLLSGKHKNYIRCGDINQAITATFTNADVEGFKEFVKTNPCVEMNCSQRCAKGIYELANKLIDYATQDQDLKDAFYPIKMQEVFGKNPVSPNCVQYNLFENQSQEKNFLLEKIKEIFEKEPNATVGLLVRNNAQVTEYSDFLVQNNINVKIGTTTLSQMQIFKVIFSILKILENPFDNELYKTTFNILNPTNLRNEYWNNLKIPFIKINPDEIQENSIISFWWDINYWLSLSNLRISELAQKIGIYYFKGNIDRSDIYLICALIQKISTTVKTNRELLLKLEEISFRTGYGGIKFFENEIGDEAKNPDNQLASKVQIMTIHKSKGAEFDYVFLPQMTTKAITLHDNNSKIKSDNIFMEYVKTLNPNYKQKGKEELLKNQIEENARLLYVAITRAKRQLYFSCAQKYKIRFREQEAVPCDFLEILFEDKAVKNGK